MTSTKPAEKSAKEIAEAKALADAQLRLDYARLFEGEIGRKVLADLMEKFGWHDAENRIEKPSYTPGQPTEAAIFNDAIKAPVRYILRMIAPRPEKQQPTEAISQ